MSYESSGIFTEGRTLHFGQEAGCGTIEPRKGKTGPKPKPKDTQVCVECGCGIHKSKARDFKPGQLYCSPSCNYTAKRRITDERAKCLACHALVGMTARASGKMVAVVGAVISLERKKRGIIGGSYKLASKVSHMKTEARDRPFKAKEEAIEQWRYDEWGCVTECYWGDMLTPDVDRIVMMGDGVDASGMSKAMLWYYRDHAKSKAKMAKYASARYHASRGDEVAIVRRKLRNHIHRVCRLSGSKKQRKTIEYLGCTIPEARAHLQKQFKRGMKWENHGEVWEIDHIVPMSHFDLMNESQRMRVNHFTNLQPLFKAENRMKRDRLLVSHQLALI